MAAHPYIPPWERRRGPLPPAKPLASPVGGGSSPYKRGREFERSIRGRLERHGYFVMRSYGSKSKVDLLAVGKDRPPLFIQCKRRGQISSGEWNALYELAENAGAWPVLATKLSERTVGFYRLDGPREFRKRARPMTLFDPADCSELVPPPLLF